MDEEEKKEVGKEKEKVDEAEKSFMEKADEAMAGFNKGLAEEAIITEQLNQVHLNHEVLSSNP